MRTLSFVVAIALGALILASSTGCETVKGFGKDVHDASSSVQSAFAVE